MFAPYKPPYTLPIPAGKQPSSVTTAPSVNYPDASSGGLIDLAGVAANFSLRFSGEQGPSDASQLHTWRDQVLRLAESSPVFGVQDCCPMPYLLEQTRATAELVAHRDADRVACLGLA